MVAIIFYLFQDYRGPYVYFEENILLGKLCNNKLGSLIYKKTFKFTLLWFETSENVTKCSLHFNHLWKFTLVLCLSTFIHRRDMLHLYFWNRMVLFMNYLNTFVSNNLQQRNYTIIYIIVKRYNHNIFI